MLDKRVAHSVMHESGTYFLILYKAKVIKHKGGSKGAMGHGPLYHSDTWSLSGPNEI